MAPPKQPNLRKFHLNLDRSDFEKLTERYGATIGVSQAIRIAVKRMLARDEDQPPTETISL